MLNSTASLPQESSSTPRGIRRWHKRWNGDRVTAVQLFYHEWRKCHLRARLFRS